MYFGCLCVLGRRKHDFNDPLRLNNVLENAGCPDAMSDKTFSYVENHDAVVIRVYSSTYLLHRSPRNLVLSIQAGTPASCVSHLDVIFNCYVQRAGVRVAS